jgi:chromosome partitioning protein
VGKGEFMRLIALINQKGGVGKTTSAINLACGLVRLSQRVLLIDLDPQSNTSSGLGLAKGGEGNSSYDLLIHQKRVTPQTAFGVDVIPASLRLVTAEAELSAKMARENFLRRMMSHYRDYDFVLIDCPPSLSLLTINALVAVEKAYVPMETEIFAVEGISQLLDTLQSIKEVNPALTLGGVFITKYDKRNASKEKYIQNFQSIFEEDLLATRIRLNIALSKAQEEGVPIFEYAPDSYGAKDYLALAQEILRREEEGEPYGKK